MTVVSHELIRGRIGEKDVATQSHISLGYGKVPHISTCLEFETFHQFYYIQDVLEGLELCKLNERHLKGTAAKHK